MAVGKRTILLFIYLFVICIFQLQSLPLFVLHKSRVYERCFDRKIHGNAKIREETINKSMMCRSVMLNNVFTHLDLLY